MTPNSMYFSSQELAIDFVKSLLTTGKEDQEHYVDIRVVQDTVGGTIVEFVQVPYSGEWGGKFRYIDQDNGEIVMIERELPDHTFSYYYNEKDYQETLQEFLKEHPNYKQNQYGRWYDEEEEKELKKLFEE